MYPFLLPDSPPPLVPARSTNRTTPVSSHTPNANSFGADGLDADMVKCALLVEATSRGLAEFAKAGKYRALDEHD